MLLWNLQVQAGVRLSHNSHLLHNAYEDTEVDIRRQAPTMPWTQERTMGYSSGEEDDDSTGDPSDTEPLYRSGSEMDSYHLLQVRHCLCCHLILFSEERRG